MGNILILEVTLITGNVDAVRNHRSLWAHSLLCTGTGWRQIADAQRSSLGRTSLITRFLGGVTKHRPRFVYEKFHLKIQFALKMFANEFYGILEKFG